MNPRVATAAHRLAVDVDEERMDVTARVAALCREMKPRHALTVLRAMNVLLAAAWVNHKRKAA